MTVTVEGDDVVLSLLPNRHILPAGVLRKIRVNRAYIVNGPDEADLNRQAPWIVVEGGVETQYEDVLILGASRAVYDDQPRRMAWIETSSPLIVRPAQAPKPQSVVYATPPRSEKDNYAFPRCG